MDFEFGVDVSVAGGITRGIIGGITEGITEGISGGITGRVGGTVGTHSRLGDISSDSCSSGSS